jgi:hypothetical protein
MEAHDRARREHNTSSKVSLDSDRFHRALNPLSSSIELVYTRPITPPRMLPPPVTLPGQRELIRAPGLLFMQQGVEKYVTQLYPRLFPRVKPLIL